MQEKTTSELEQELSGKADLSKFLHENEEQLTEGDDVSRILRAFMEQKGISRKELIEASGINDIYTHQILSGIRRPSRDKLLAICIALQMDAKQIRDLMNRCGYQPLYARNNRDSVILFGILHEYTLMQINLSLFKAHQPPLN